MAARDREHAGALGARSVALGFFDRIFRRWSKAPPPSPEELRERLFDAASTDDRASLEDLCRHNEAAIAEHFPSWQKVPDDVRADPARLNRYARVKTHTITFGLVVLLMAAGGGGFLLGRVSRATR